MTPALLRRTSIDSPLRPDAACRILDRSVTSIGRTLTEGVRASFWRSWAASGTRQAAKIRQPSAAYCLTNSRPRPRLALVIMIEGIQFTSFGAGLVPAIGWSVKTRFVASLGGVRMIGFSAIARPGTPGRLAIAGETWWPTDPQKNS